MIKFFFMAVLSANLEGRPQVQFNTITAIDTRNVTAATLTRIQDAAAQMVSQQGVTFDDLVIHNIFFLAECTEEEFVAGTQLRSDAAVADVSAEVELAEAGEVLSPKVELAVDNTIGTDSDLSELGIESLKSIPVDDVITADVKTEA